METSPIARRNGLSGRSRFRPVKGAGQSSSARCRYTYARQPLDPQHPAIFRGPDACRLEADDLTNRWPRGRHTALVATITLGLGDALQLTLQHRLTLCLTHGDRQHEPADRPLLDPIADKKGDSPLTVPGAVAFNVIQRGTDRPQVKSPSAPQELAPAYLLTPPPSPAHPARDTRMPVQCPISGRSQPARCPPV